MFAVTGSVLRRTHPSPRFRFSMREFSVKTSFVKIEPKQDPHFGTPCSRSSHGLSLINNGTRIVLYGGEHIARTPLDGTDTLWAADLNLSTETWEWRCINTESMPPKRVAHAQAAARDNCIYVFGGRAGVEMKEEAMNDLWKLDASGKKGSEVWTKVEPNDSSDPPPEVRSFHKMVCVGDSLFVFGGCGVHSRLADLHRFDLTNNSWHTLDASALLRGRGGANLIPLNSASVLAVVAGFAGEETADGHTYDIEKEIWEDSLMGDALAELRPRSVCCSASFPSTGVSVVFGGEVDPSERGHEGAGGFQNDIVYLDEKTGQHLHTDAAPSDAKNWPQTRGWADSASVDNGDGTGHMYVFGGLTGDDSNPQRLSDLWRLDIEK